MRTIVDYLMITAFDQSPQRINPVPPDVREHLEAEKIRSSVHSTSGQGGYIELSRQIKNAGLFSTRNHSDVPKMALNACFLLAGWIAFFLVGNSWYQLIVAFYMAVAFTQTAFVGHDLGHRQTSRSPRANQAIGMIHVNLLLGMSFSWWIGKHNRHHAYPNQEGKDPDIATGAFIWSKAQSLDRRGFRRFLARYQAVLFFPMLLLEALHLHFASIRSLASRSDRTRIAEAMLIGLHALLYFTAIFTVLSPLRAVVFIAVQQGLFGLYLGCAFAPNHKGMQILENGDQTDFLKRQVCTARNVRGGWLVDHALGGLNYQIEHHLFPTMPRHKLRHSRPIVKAFCESQGLAYVEVPLLGSYVQIVRYLHSVGAPLRN